MANIWEKAISILAGNLNLGRSYLITTVRMLIFGPKFVWFCIPELETWQRILPFVFPLVPFFTLVWSNWTFSLTSMDPEIWKEIKDKRQDL